MSSCKRICDFRFLSQFHTRHNGHKSNEAVYFIQQYPCIHSVASKGLSHTNKYEYLPIEIHTHTNDFTTNIDGTF